MPYRRPPRLDAIAASIAFLLAATSPSWAQQPEPAKSWIKADSKLVVVIQVAKFLDGPEKQSIAEISNLHPIVLSWALRDAEQMTGLTTADVTRLVVSEEWPAGFLFAVETTGQAQADELCIKLAPGVTPTAVAAGSLYEGENYGLLRVAPQSVLVSAPPDAVQAAVAGLATPSAAPRELEEPEGADLALLDLYLQPAALSDMPELAQAPPQVAALLNASSFRVRFEPARSLTFRVIAEFPAEATAEAGVESLEFVAAQLAAYMDMCEQNIPPALKGFAKEYPDAEKLVPTFVQAIRAAKAGLQAPQVTREGTTVSMVCSIASERPVTDAILLLSLLPRAAK